MKYIVAFIIIGLLLAFFEKSCKDDLKWSWWKDGTIAQAQFINNSDKFIRITEISFFDNDSDLIKKTKPTRIFRKKSESKGFFIGPKEKKNYRTSIGSSINYVKTASYTCEFQKPYDKSFTESAGDLLGSAGDAVEDVNPVNYFAKRKKCKERQDRADTVAIGKRWYKECMKEN